ncbi:MAG: hypothetical protein QNJ46_16835 [Leptolyngbyaceae cyanobacterium MO_188.B28]|nr:hypothetical protein [Leptolyngbyaceae cyanobacterium MO_188.B28]
MWNSITTFIDNLPAIIDKSASSPLAMLALTLLVGAALAWLFFRKESVKVRLFIYCALLIGVSTLIIALNQAATTVGGQPEGPPIEPSPPPIEPSPPPIEPSPSPIQPSPPPIEPQNPTLKSSPIQPDKDIYTSLETIKVEFDVADRLPDDGGWPVLGISPASAPDDQTGSQRVRIGASGQHTFAAQRPGDYQIRISYRQTNGGYVPVARYPITVQAYPVESKPSSNSIQTDKTLYTSLEEIKVKFDVADRVPSDGGWPIIGVSLASAPDNQTGQQREKIGASGQHTFAAQRPGDYQIRISYRQTNGFYVPVIRYPITVQPYPSDFQPSSNSIQTDKTVYTALEVIEVEFDVADRVPSDGGWPIIGISPASAPDNQTGSQRVRIGESGQHTFAAQRPGDYQIRISYRQTNGGYVPVARYPITVIEYQP